MEKFVVYILYSKKLRCYYIGTTDDFLRRLNEHNSLIRKDSFTWRGRPWVKFLAIEELSSQQAYCIEAHIKKMKSSKYIENLLKYPEIIEKLKEENKF